MDRKTIEVRARELLAVLGMHPQSETHNQKRALEEVANFAAQIAEEVREEDAKALEQCTKLFRFDGRGDEIAVIDLAEAQAAIRGRTGKNTQT